MQTVHRDSGRLKHLIWHSALLIAGRRRPELLLFPTPLLIPLLFRLVPVLSPALSLLRWLLQVLKPRIRSSPSLFLPTKTLSGLIPTATVSMNLPPVTPWLTWASAG